LRHAQAFPSKQKLMALIFAELWHREVTEQDYIQALTNLTGIPQTRHMVKRAMDEVREKLREPFTRFLREEGIYARR